MISREFCENYNNLFTRIKSINKLKKSNIIEKEMFLQSNLDYRVQKYSKHFLIRQVTDDKAFNQYLSLIIVRWNRNFKYAVKMIEDSILSIEAMEIEYQKFV